MHPTETGLVFTNLVYTIMNFDQIENMLGRLRYISIIAVVSSGFGSILMFVIGAVKTFKAYTIFFNDDVLVSTVPGSIAKQVIAFLVQGVDAFLIALVLMIFSGEVYNLFIHRVEGDSQLKTSQTRISSIAQLKSIIAELIVIILFVKFLEDILGSDINTYQWEILVLPVSILLLALSLKFLNLKDRED